jgi:hypothetical protein
MSSDRLTSVADAAWITTDGVREADILTAMSDYSRAEAAGRAGIRMELHAAHRA